MNSVALIVYAACALNLGVYCNGETLFGEPVWSGEQVTLVVRNEYPAAPGAKTLVVVGFGTCSPPGRLLDVWNARLSSSIPYPEDRCDTWTSPGSDSSCTSDECVYRWWFGIDSFQPEFGSFAHLASLRQLYGFRVEDAGAPNSLVSYNRLFRASASHPSGLQWAAVPSDSGPYNDSLRFDYVTTVSTATLARCRVPCDSAEDCPAVEIVDSFDGSVDYQFSLYSDTVRSRSDYSSLDVKCTSQTYFYNTGTSLLSTVGGVTVSAETRALSMRTVGLVSRMRLRFRTWGTIDITGNGSVAFKPLMGALAAVVTEQLLLLRGPQLWSVVVTVDPPYLVSSSNLVPARKKDANSEPRKPSVLSGLAGNTQSRRILGVGSLLLELMFNVSYVVDGLSVNRHLLAMRMVNSHFVSTKTDYSLFSLWRQKAASMGIVYDQIMNITGQEYPLTIMSDSELTVPVSLVAVPVSSLAVPVIALVAGLGVCCATLFCRRSGERHNDHL